MNVVLASAHGELLDRRVGRPRAGRVDRRSGGRRDGDRRRRGQLPDQRRVYVAVRGKEPQRARDTSVGPGAGLALLLHDPLLRPIVIASAVASVGFDLSLAVTVLFLLRDIGLGAAFVGLAFAARGFGAVPGALAADRTANRFGLGRAIAGGWMVQGLGLLILPLAAGPLPLALATVAVSGLVAGGGETIANVGQWSLRQAIVPDDLQARVTGAHRAIVYGAGTLGAAAGGILGETIGLRATLAVGATIFLAANIAFTRTGVLSVHDLDDATARTDGNEARQRCHVLLKGSGSRDWEAGIVARVRAQSVVGPELGRDVSQDEALRQLST
jgi:Major Facilitator Superfamily